jgi:hypothetical protein
LDPSTFSAAFRTSETSWASPTDETRDATAALLSRYRTGICPEGCGFASSPRLAGLLSPRASRKSLPVVAGSFLGRAPPPFILQS